ncbi:MAG: acyltransferase family protein [Candidatus Heimdallarchaeota archaeon]
MNQNGQSGHKRLNFVDNLRIFLTSLVILHHAAIGYGGYGGWFLYQADFSPIDDFTIILLTFFVAINQSYFMSIFFLFAGYFTVQSYNRKGPLIFYRDRFIRFLIPILLYLIFLNPLLNLMLLKGAYEVETDYFILFEDNLTNIWNGIGHLWFLFALLLFSIGYGVYRSINGESNQLAQAGHEKISFPSQKLILVSIGGLSLITFIIRLEYAIGETELFGFQFAHFTHYLFSFIIGIVSYQKQWHHALSWERIKPYALTGLLLVPAALVFLISLADFSTAAPFDPFIGGFTYQSFLYVVVESIALICFTITLLYLFQAYFNFQNGFTQEIAQSCYTGYIIHPLVVISLMIPLLSVSIFPLGKFVIVSTLSLALVFSISFLIRQIPFAKRILG